MADAQDAVAALTRGLQEALGADLVSLMLYGSEARGMAIRGWSDVNVLVVLKDASAAVLGRAAGPLKAWRKTGHPAPLIQTEAEWRAAADVFPLEIEDVRDAHRLLAGRDVISGLATKRADLREELEREARGKLVRLRAEYAVADGDRAAVATLLARATGTFLVFFRAALRLAGQPVPAEPGELVRAAADLVGFDAGAFGWALAARAAAGKLKSAPDGALAANYLVAVERFVGYVNDLEV